MDSRDKVFPLHRKVARFIGNALNEKVNNTSAEKNAEQIAEVLIKEIPNKKIARQFVLEELDAARYGSDEAQEFVLKSGFKPFEYEGAMQDPQWEDSSIMTRLQTNMQIVSY